VVSRALSVLTREEAERRDKYLRRTYGISLTVYSVMLATQDGRCAICARPPKPGKNLNVDHDHKTGRVRGLLCFHCNHMLLGRGRENADRHEAAAAYLRSNRDWRTAA